MPAAEPSTKHGAPAGKAQGKRRQQQGAIEMLGNAEAEERLARAEDEEAKLEALRERQVT